mmetsp:Transcript_23646/g.69416  ORF Transcript_23646/g.69416 Transcript_23646/m.69416 type:complete len:128 (+) Transcript_23646:98-481(+)
MDATMTVRNSIIYNCVSSRGAGPMPFGAGSTMKLYDTQIEGLVAGSHAGGMYASTGGRLEATDVNVKDCTTGGGIRVASAVALLTRVTFTSCSAPTGSGGGAVLEKGALTLSNVSFTDCSAALTTGL